MTKNVRWERCILREAVLAGAGLEGAVFDRCDLTDADLQGALLRGADLRTSEISGLRARPEDLRGVVLAPHQAVQVVGLVGVVIREIEGPIA